ncbi:hypothetical protein V8F33_010812 [Rhypophila sp. PSN 637]|uniref:NADH-ubiquinone oxidoreductase 9.5 kDa subunit n=1 Tax=Rhypophila decipiens TaxID=261697 RepID=A0AAN6YI63_9PEZI|nr:putative NADH-ubiquinone oxidoreductase 9.5 kDa subunit [Rhypophila decipiens]
MSAATPRFWAGPIRYLKWSARERPSYFWSCVIGALGPAHLLIVPPVRRYFGDYDAPPIPMTYPVPTGPRKKLTGYGDETETN